MSLNWHQRKCTHRVNIILDLYNEIKGHFVLFTSEEGVRKLEVNLHPKMVEPSESAVWKNAKVQSIANACC